MNKHSLARVAVALMLVGALWMAHAYGQQFGSQAAKLDLVKVKDDLYVIHNDFVPGNSTALITNDGVVLVDDKFEVDFNNIVAELKKVTDKPITYVINTHHHGDHSGGNAKMQAMSVQVVASEQARQNMVDGNQPGLPVVVFEHHAHIYLGGKNVELYHFGRAHTNGDVVVYFPAHRTLAAGRHVHLRRCDAAVDRLRRRRKREGMDLDARLRAAAGLRYGRPGHGPVTTKQGDAQVPR